MLPLPVIIDIIKAFKTELGFSVKCAYVYFPNPRQMSIWSCQISAGSSNPDDNFGFGLRNRIRVWTG
jgi:hypothetical protein